MTKNELLRELKNPCFADRETISEAYDYAFDMLKAEGCTPVYLATAIHVLMNAIAKQVEELEN